MKTEKQLKYLKQLQILKQKGFISKQEYKKQIKWFRQNFNK